MNNVPIEGGLWLTLALLCWYSNHSSDVAIITVVHLVVRIYFDITRKEESSTQPTRNNDDRSDVVRIWRYPTATTSDIDTTTTNADATGMYMSITLLPILFESMAILIQQRQQKRFIYSDGSYQMKYHHATLYLHFAAIIVSILQILFWNTTNTKNSSSRNNHQRLWTRRKFIPYTIALFVLVFLLVVSYTDIVPVLNCEMWFCYFWICIVFLLGPYQYPSLQGILTPGEWLVISSIASFVWTSIWCLLLNDMRNYRTTTGVPVYEYRSVDTEGSSATDTNSSSMIYAYTAIAGVFGCIVACSTVNYTLQFTTTNQWIQENFQSKLPLFCDSTIFNNILRFAYISVVTLGIVECTFWYSNLTAQQPFPKCIWWIFYDFLFTIETLSHNYGATLRGEYFISLFPMVHQLPRISWLIYWFATMFVTIPLAPRCTSPVIARKWFHFVAVLLFVPTTILVPQLQSLSYAVAICVLLIVEVIRIDIPALNEFYYTYLDQTKDEADDTKFVVSHIALVAGCAMPLWIIQYLTYFGYNESNLSGVPNYLIVSVGLWGVWVLGIGDAMGALIGKLYGRIKWGCNSRTIEGSSAMFLSLSLACFVTSIYTSNEKLYELKPQLVESTALWLPAVLFVTLIEAYTLQIDNIVLPLAGAATILVCHNIQEK